MKHGVVTCRKPVRSQHVAHGSWVTGHQQERPRCIRVWCLCGCADFFGCVCARACACDTRAHVHALTFKNPALPACSGGNPRHIHIAHMLDTLPPSAACWTSFASSRSNHMTASRCAPSVCKASCCCAAEGWPGVCKEKSATQIWARGFIP